MADRPSWFTYRDGKKNPVGTYRRYFTIPASWKGRDVYVRFNSVGPGYYLWINGQRIGYSEDSYLPSEFKITDYLVEGDNTIALQVYRFTSGSFLECQDYWRLTGIHRSCFLWSAPKSQIRDYFFTTDLDASYTNAKANVKVTVTGSDAVSGGTVEASIVRNHVCIFMWSFGNESGNGNNFQAVQTAIKALDKTRLTHYEGNSDYADVSSTMYASYETINWIGQSQKNRPHIQCENSHSMGNSMGNVREMFDLYEKYPCLTGEFIWDFKDQGLLTKSSSGKEYWAYGGDFGDNPNDGNFCINGLVHPDWSYTAKTYNTKKIYQPLEWAAVSGKTNVFRMKNKLAFLPSTTYDVSYSVMDEEGNVLSSATISDDVAADATKDITIDLSALNAQLSADKEAFIYFCAKQRETTAWAEAGYVVAEEKLPVKTATKPMKNLNFANADAMTVEETNTDVNVCGANFKATFSKSKGTLTGYTLDGV